ncbi:MAG: pyridoxamine 5'-phosphate oxidase family protein [Massilia sp.]
MDSINRNQAEDNHDDLAGKQAVDKIKELVKSAQTCFFCTRGHSGPTAGVRPMSVQQVDDQGNLWFLSANDSYKNRELQDDPAVTLYFQGSAHAEFLHLGGIASVSQDMAKIRELWNFVMKTWFTEGEDDPRITVIKVAPTHAYYWDTKHGRMVAGAKMMLGAAVGKTLDDSIEGNIRV